MREKSLLTAWAFEREHYLIDQYYANRKQKRYKRPQTVFIGTPVGICANTNNKQRCNDSPAPIVKPPSPDESFPLARIKPLQILLFLGFLLRVVFRDYTQRSPRRLNQVKQRILRGLHPNLLWRRGSNKTKTPRSIECGVCLSGSTPVEIEALDNKATVRTVAVDSK